MSYQSTDLGHSLLSGERKDKSWGGLRKRTKVIIVLSVILIIAAIVATVVVLKVEDDEKDKNEKKCILNEVRDNPPAPKPERIQLQTIPLPPASPSNASDACSLSVNPRGTGCIDPMPLTMQSGSFLPDGIHVTATVTFSGSLPSSIYYGPHLIIIKSDGTTFSNGDPWKCLTCGIPANNSGLNLDNGYGYPQSFIDGKRIMAGNNVIDCSPFYLHDDNCSPNSTYIYPIVWSAASIRELRLHPNNSYIGFNSMYFSEGEIGQFGAFGSLSFVNSGASFPYYAINNVTVLLNPAPEMQMFYPNPKNSSEIIFNPFAPTVGEFRGFSKDGTELLWIGQPVESGNFDIMGTSMTTGITRRLTRNQEYTDPVDMSPDNGYIVVMDTRGSNRLEFAAGMRGIPPLTDFATTATVASIRNNGDRRFFQGYLIDKYGDRGEYQGQKLTEDPAYDDPNWNGMADPRWSPDGTKVAFWQALVTSPACGGVNPLVCPNSTEPGGRRYRAIIASFLDRTPISYPYSLPPVPDKIPWATPFTSIASLPTRYILPNGNYTLHGNVSGSAFISLNFTSTLTSVSVSYSHYSDDGYFIIDGDESAINYRDSPLVAKILWNSNLTLSGCEEGRKFTSANGYYITIDIMNPIADSVGTLSTTLGNVTYVSPNPGT